MLSSSMEMYNRVSKTLFWERTKGRKPKHWVTSPQAGNCSCSPDPWPTVGVGYRSSFWLRRSPWESDMQVSKCVWSTCSECSTATKCYHCYLWGPMATDRTVKSHASLRSSTVWAGSFPFLTHEDIHWLSICLPRNPWAETSLETVVPTSAWQCSPLSKPLTRILMYLTVDCYRTETP